MDPQQSPDPRPSTPPPANPAMDVVAPPPAEPSEKDQPNPPSRSDKPLLPTPEKKPQTPAKPKQPKQPHSGVGLAVVATVIIVLGLAALATYAYLQTNK